MISTGEEMVLKRVAGGSITEDRPLFSSDSMSLFVIWEDGVRQYSVRTGQCVQKLDAPTSARILSLQSCPSEPDNLYAITSNGELICWKQETGVFDSMKDLLPDLPAHKKVSGFHMTSHSSIIVTIDDMEKNIQKYTLCSTESKEKEVLAVIGRIGKTSSSLGGLDDDEFLATVTEFNLRIMNVKTKKKYKHKVNSDWGNLTCVRAHQKLLLVATCDMAGRILIWHDFTSPTKPAVKTLHHWHKNPVNDVVFTAQASCFYSGGSETVLVKWWKDGDSNDYLSNMGATIKNLTVSPDNKYVAAGMADNAIHLITPGLKYHQTIQHVSSNFEQREGVQPAISNLTLDPRAKALVISGRSGHVQFYSVEKQEYLFQVDVVAQNFLNRERNTELVNTEVVHTAMSADGNWLATVEERDDGVTHVECRIKFWKWHWQEMFKLNTSIENPHQGKINSIAFQQVNKIEPKFISSGMNGKFIVWSRQEDLWRYNFVGTFDQQIPSPVAFSQDGSMYAVGFENLLSVWSSKCNKLKSCLSRPDMSGSINFIKFGHCEASRYIVAATSSVISIWDLLTLKLRQLISMKVTCLASNPMSSHMAAFTSNGKLVVFAPNESKPLFCQALNLPSPVCSALFLPLDEIKTQQVSWQKRAILYFATESQEIYTLTRNSIEDEETGSSVTILPMKDFSQFSTPLAALVSTKTSSEVVKAGPAPLWQQQVDSHQGSYLKMMCETPAHMMPPLQLLVGDLIQEYLDIQSAGPKGTATSETQQQEEAMQVDDEYSSDSDKEDTNDKKNSEETNEKENAGVKKGYPIEKQDKLQQVVNEDSKWVEMLFDSIRSTASD